MKLCPRCGKIVDFSSYFQKWMCQYCHWHSEEVDKRHREGLDSEKRIKELEAGITRALVEMEAGNKQLASNHLRCLLHLSQS